MSDAASRSIDPRRRHAPVGQVGEELRRVRRRRGTRRARRCRPRVERRRLPRRRATRCATAIPATSPARRSRRRSAGEAYRCRRAMRRARAVWSRSKPRAPGSGPGWPTSRWSSVPTRRPRGSSDRCPVSGRKTPTGSASTCSARRTPRTSRCTRGGGWSSTAPRRRTSPRSRSRTAGTACANPNARYRKEFTDDEIAESPVVADPLRLVDICATSDGGAAVVLASAEFAASRTAAKPKVEVAAISTVTPTYPNTYLDLPDIATDSGGRRATPAAVVPRLHRARRVRGGRPRPRRPLAAPRCTTSRPRSSSTGTRTSACARPVRRRRSCTPARRRSAGASPSTRAGGSRRFGEAIPAQAIAQVCELTWQLRGEAGDRQVDGANVGLSINQGLFGHGSCVILTR